MTSLESVMDKAACVYTEEEHAEPAERNNNSYLELLEHMHESAVLQNVKEVPAGLKERGLLLAVGSASKNAPVILEKTGLLPYLDKISCGLDTTKSKPDPEVFLVAAHKLELSPRQCLVVEDSAAGIEAAAAGGMKSLGVGPFYRSLHADYEAPLLCEVQNWDEILK